MFESQIIFFQKSENTEIQPQQDTKSKQTQRVVKGTNFALPSCLSVY